MAIAEDAGPRHALARPPAPGQELRPVPGGAAVGGAAVLQTRPLLLISGTKYSFSNFYITLFCSLWQFWSLLSVEFCGHATLF